MRTVADVLEDEGTKFILAKGESRASRAELSRTLLNRTGVRISNDSGLTTLFTAHVQHQNGDTPRELMRLDLVQLSDRADYQAKIRTGQIAHKPEHIRISTVEGQELHARLDEDFRRIEDTLAPVEIVAAPAEDPAEAVHNLEAAIVKASRKFIKEMVALASESSENRARIKKLYEEYKAKKGSESWITKTARIPVTEALSRVTRAMKKDEENEILAAHFVAATHPSEVIKLVCSARPGSSKYKKVMRIFFPHGTHDRQKFHEEEYSKSRHRCWTLMKSDTHGKIDKFLSIAERSNGEQVRDLISSGVVKKQRGHNKPKKLQIGDRRKIQKSEGPPPGFKPAKRSKKGGFTDGKGNYWYPPTTAQVVTAHGTGEPGETPDDVKAMDILSGALHGEMSPHMFSVTSPFELGIRQVVGGPVVYRAMHYQGAYEVYQGSKEMIRSASVRAIVDFLCGNPPTVVTAQDPPGIIKLVCPARPGSPRYKKVISAFFPRGAHDKQKFHEEEYSKSRHKCWTLMKSDTHSKIDKFLSTAERNNGEQVRELISSGAVKKQRGHNRPKKIRKWDRRKSQEGPPPGFKPAKRSKKGGFTDGKGSYWYPSDSK